MTAPDSFPRRYARTQRFSLGSPRDVRVAADGSRISFLRSRGGTDPVTCLYAMDLRSGGERLVADPREIGPAGDAELPAAERARRERAREGASGIVAYDADGTLTTATFALEGRLYLADFDGGGVQPLVAADGAFDPRLSPEGKRVAYVAGSELRVTDRAGHDRLVVAGDAPGISWGSAEFVAGEEMGRTRGHWWSPDGVAFLAERVDVTPVAEWWIAAPAAPWQVPVRIRYPAAGTANAAVELAIVSLDGVRTTIEWRRGEFEYVASVRWAPEARPMLVVQTRDQKTLAVLDVDPASGATTELHRETDDHWVELTPGAPRLSEGALWWIAVRGGSMRLLCDGRPLTPPGLEVRGLVDVTGGTATILASPSPAYANVYRVGAGGTIEALGEGRGVAAAVASGGVTVTTERSLEWSGTRTVVRDVGGRTRPVASLAQDPAIVPAVELLELGPRRLATALVLPRDRREGRLPILMDPYAGPHAQRVVASRDAYLVPQWFADQGFAVVVVDGRGTPGRGPSWEREVAGDLAAPVLADQVEALTLLCDQRPELDPSRVAIRGWSFGGYLSALAVLRRPDVFHAAVAGAPVTDWRMYDTHYTERYLGHPESDPAAYARCDLIADAAALRRPLLLIHGLADDNVVAAHTLRLSRALLEAGRPHQVLPLADVSHMTPQEVVAENLLLFQLRFLRDALGIEPT